MLNISTLCSSDVLWLVIGSSDIPQCLSLGLVKNDKQQTNVFRGGVGNLGTAFQEAILKKGQPIF